MKHKLRISNSAVGDIENVLDYTLTQFGERKHEQYKQMIRQALAAIAANPLSVASKARPEIGSEVRTYHLGGRGMRARHLFLYRIAADGFVEVSRLLHDSIDVDQHAP
jgi:toxin ParE1/3/4